MHWSNNNPCISLQPNMTGNVYRKAGKMAINWDAYQCRRQANVHINDNHQFSYPIIIQWNWFNATTLTCGSYRALMTFPANRVSARCVISDNTTPPHWNNQVHHGKRAGMDNHNIFIQRQKESWKRKFHREVGSERWDQEGQAYMEIWPRAVSEPQIREVRSDTWGE